MMAAVALEGNHIGQARVRNAWRPDLGSDRAGLAYRFSLQLMRPSRLDELRQ
jgi:hypothetical protein